MTGGGQGEGHNHHSEVCTGPAYSNGIKNMKQSVLLIESGGIEHGSPVSRTIKAVNIHHNNSSLRELNMMCIILDRCHKSYYLPNSTCFFVELINIFHTHFFLLFL
uniref:Uncharacterized protein n=1 Tax=Cacopsylla melanoneura TaxID=428564 RepID=A0A8D8WWH4_9HEMI